LETNHNQFTPPIRIVASRRRRRTVAARLRSGVLELLVPDWMPGAERERWAEEMRRRLERRMERARLWGSCTFTMGAIRIATRAASLPEWVIDYLVVHELAHLEHSDHGPAFHELENRYPLTERARGYLMAIDQAAALKA